MMGNDSVYKQYIQRAQYYKNLFDPSTHNMRGKIQGMWYTPFDPKEINNFYTEGNSWQYSFAVPQDIETLIQLHGGREAFASKLNELFTTSSQTTGRQQSDVTGLIGQYAHGNEPSHHMAYLFNYIGMPWRTQELVNKISTEFYTNDPDGLIGNEDCGQMSAWYILSAMGFYPVCPGNGEYVLGTPLFEEVTINLESGKKFVIRKTQKIKTQNAIYIEATKLNGKTSTKSYFLHTDVIKGGLLEFIVSNQPNKVWGTNDSDLPHSKISDHPIVAVPYFDVSTNKFKNSLSVPIRSIQQDSIFYLITDSSDHDLGMRKGNLYTHPITIHNTCKILAWGSGDKHNNSMVSQTFYKILLQGKPLNYVGIHVLQDVSPWILYPKEVIIYYSEDGNIFKETTRIKNKIDQFNGAAQTQVLGTNVNLTARYIKVKAINGGKLPSWHESAGNPSHIFIDEVIAR